MKSYTNIQQSKALSDILPLETADGFYEAQFNPLTGEWENLLFVGNEWASSEVVIPAWSLTALLDFLKPNVTLDHTEGEGWKVESLYVIDEPNSILQPIKTINGFSENEPIDACVNMIMKLKEENLI